MNAKEIKERFSGLQTHLKFCGDFGCYFLSLLSIAEESSEKEIDLTNAIDLCLKKKLIQFDFFVLNPTAILENFTNQKWSMTKLKKLPSSVPENMFTIEKWQWKGANHFKRRYVDTIENGANTCRNGELVEYYCFSKLNMEENS